MRAIDADVLINEWNEKAVKMSRDRDGAIPVDFSLVISAVSKAPTLTLDDLRPKGRWIMKETMIRSPFAKNAYCSECNEETSFLHGFCPNCGADMRGGGEDG